MFREMCYLNTLRACLPRWIIWVPYINVCQEPEAGARRAAGHDSKPRESQRLKRWHSEKPWIPYINASRDVLSEYLTQMFAKMCYLSTLHKCWPRARGWSQTRSRPRFKAESQRLKLWHSENREYLEWMFREMFYLNTLHKCLPRCVI